MKKKLLLVLAAGMLGFMTPKTTNAAEWNVCGNIFYAPGIMDYLYAGYGYLETLLNLWEDARFYQDYYECNEEFEIPDYVAIEDDYTESILETESVPE
ncbi:hypothetical protein FACS1894174_03390 [Bacteroidia bacterium]|nr:hypothetical protein FACS1894174_03390 [Bacteroidia bacterium]